MRMRKNCKRRYEKDTEETGFYWKGTNLLTVLMAAATIAILLGAGVLSGFALIHGAHAFGGESHFGEYISSASNFKGVEKVVGSGCCDDSHRNFGGYVSSLAANTEASLVTCGCGAWRGCLDPLCTYPLICGGTKVCYRYGCGAMENCIPAGCGWVCNFYGCGYRYCDCGGVYCGWGGLFCPGIICQFWWLGCQNINECGGA